MADCVPRGAIPRRRMIAVALGEPTTDRMRAAMAQAASVADIVELRLDLMDEVDLPRLLAGRPCPVIVTCRAAREGGRWHGTEAARLDMLRRAIDLGAEYVDVEADAIHAIRERGQSQLIASSHDFAAMPPDLPACYRALAETVADVVKIVGMARMPEDVWPVLDLFGIADRPTIAIGMGEAGLATRVLALRHEACLLTFCALDSGGGTAPGQITVSEMLNVYGARGISEGTAAIGLLGPAPDPDVIRRWNAALREAGADAVAVPFVVPDGGSAPDAISALRELDLRALWVAPAFQETVGQAVDTLDTSACRRGRVNLIETRDGQFVGCWAETEEDAVKQLTAGLEAR